MHRSGTSAVGTLLAAAGVYGGPAELQMASDVSNPGGYAELQPIADFNDEVLAQAGWVWDAPSAEPLMHTVVRSDHVVRGRSLAASYLQQSPAFAKDPRFSLLLPLWRRILVDRFVAVIVVRPSLEVAWSLAVRDGLPTTIGLALWSAYHRHLAAGLNGMQVIAIDYVRLVQQPVATTESFLLALRELGTTLDVDPHHVARVIYPELRRSSVPDYVETARAIPMDELLPGLHPAPVSLYSRFDLVARDPERWEVDVLEEHRLRRLEQLASVRQRSELDRLSDEHQSALRQHDQATAERDRLTAELTQTVAQRDELTAQRDQATAERDRLTAELTQTVAQRDELTAQRDQATAERDRIAEELERLVDEHTALENAVDEVSDRGREVSALARSVLETAAQLDRVGRDALVERDELTAQRDHATAERDRLAGELTQAVEQMRVDRAMFEGERDGVLRELRSARELIDAYENSTSWRLTAPGRALGRLVRRLFNRQP